MRRMTKMAALLAVPVLALAACGGNGDGDGDDTAAGGTGEPTAAVRRQGRHGVRRRRPRRPVVQRLGRRGHRPGARSSASRAEESEADDGEARPPARSACAPSPTPATTRSSRSASPTPASVAKVAAEYPDVHFAIIDDASRPTADNVANLVFAEEQGSFLVGAAAALKTETDHVGFIGGVEMPLIQKFEAGFIAGAKAVNPDITVDVELPDPAAGLLRLQRPGQGQDGGGGHVRRRRRHRLRRGRRLRRRRVRGGVRRPGRWPSASTPTSTTRSTPSVQDVILTSMLKNVDVAVFDYLTEVDDGNFPAGVNRYDLTVDGVGYSTSGGFIDDITGELDDYKQQIIDGEITVPTAPDRSTVPDPSGERRSGPAQRVRRCVLEPSHRASRRAPMSKEARSCRIRCSPPPSAGPSMRRPAARHHQAVPRRRRQPRRRHRRRARHHPRDRRRERRRQVDADEDPVRHAAAGRGHDRGRRHAGRRSARPRDAIEAGIGMVHQHFMLADNLTVLENVVLGAEQLHGIGAAGARRDHGDLRRLRPRRRARRAGRGPRRRRPPARRDPQGALPRRPDPHPRRADRGARAAGGRRAVRQPARAQGRGPHRHLHLAQARRGAVGRRRDHGDPARHDGRPPSSPATSPPDSSPS